MKFTKILATATMSTILIAGSASGAFGLIIGPADNAYGNAKLLLPKVTAKKFGSRCRVTVSALGTVTKPGVSNFISIVAEYNWVRVGTGGGSGSYQQFQTVPMGGTKFLPMSSINANSHVRFTVTATHSDGSNSVDFGSVNFGRKCR